MEVDIENLYISESDLKQVAGISKQDFNAYRKLKAPRGALLLQILLNTEQILLLGWGLIPLGYLFKWKWLRKRQSYLLEEVERYNSIVKGLEINQQLVDAGNSDLSLNDKENLVNTLITTRENLICALKTERILRKNRAFIARNREILATNLTALQTLQITLQTKNEAKDYTDILQDALHSAQDVKEEMKKLEEG